MKLYKIRLIYTNEDIERLMQSMEISNIIGLIILFYRNKDAQNLKENWEEDVFYYYCKTLNIMKGKKELKIECEEEI